MRAGFLLIGSVEATTISSYTQGAEFNKCILITDYQTKNIGDDITLTDRDAMGCCAAGSVPGTYLFNLYQGTQIVCSGQSLGASASSQSYAADGGSGKCSYGTCYVYKQNLPCLDGTKQRLNGCCSDTDKTNFEASCESYAKTFSNTHSETVRYCTSYHEGFSRVGDMGTDGRGDDAMYALQWIASDPTVGSLKVCQGDCDADSDCPGNSACITSAARAAASNVIDGCAVGDSSDAGRAATDYCSNPGGTQAPTLQIGCLNEYAACCGHAVRNGATGDCALHTPANEGYFANSNTKLTDDVCGAFPTGDTGNSGGNSGGATTTKNNSNGSDNAAVASLGGAVLVTFGAFLM